MYSGSIACCSMILSGRACISSSRLLAPPNPKSTQPIDRADQAGSSPPRSPDTQRLLVVPVVLWAKPEIQTLLPRVTDEGDSCRRAGLEIQTHLQRLRDCGVPLIEADPGCYNNAVDALHDHVLACIEACATTS